MMISLHGYVSARPELGLPDTGGQVVYLLRLSEQLARQGYVVDILTRQFEGQPAEQPVAPGVRIVRIPAGGPDLIRKEWMCDHVPEWVANAMAWIRREDLAFDFIDSHYWDAGLAGDALARQLGIPHLHTPHSIGSWKRDSMAGDPAELEPQYNFARRIRDERRIYAGAAALIATTPLQRDILGGPEYGVDPARVAIVPPGYDERRFFPVAAARRALIRRDLGVTGPLVLALGRVAANKGYDLLLRAMPTVVERIPAAHLVLAAGSTSPTPGELRQVAELRSLASELGIADRIRFHDYVPDEQLADLYRAADVFALSSRYEPFGMTAIEAMACGTPSVITTQGGLFQLLRWGTETIYANPCDPPAFGHAIVSVLGYPEVARRLAEDGAARIRTSFTWAGIARQLLAVVERLAGPAASRGRATAGAAEAVARAGAAGRPSEVAWARAGS